MENKEEGQDAYPVRIDIPKIFYSDLTGGPITNCIYCEKELLKANSPYVIEKALKPYDGYKSYSTIFEYAVCLPCADQMKSMISQKSMVSMMDFFIKNMKAQSNAKSKYGEENFEVMDWISNCAITDKHITTLSECQLYALCQNDQLMFTEFPYMVSGQALDEVVDLLSAETLDELNDFKDKVVGPSEFQDLLTKGPKVLL
ncbi:MAG: hypothetical protein OCD76_20325 [Reichenbachiella sp.]